MKKQPIKKAPAKIPQQATPPRKKWVWWIVLGVVLLIAAAVTVWLVLDRPHTRVSDTLDQCVLDTLYDQHYSSHTEGKYPVATYTVLDVEETERRVTVYGVMMYSEYTCTTQGELTQWVSAHSPFALTAKKVEGKYSLKEIWWPEDGANNASSIEKKFPLQCRGDAKNYQKYYASHRTACEEAARQHLPVEDRYTVLQTGDKSLSLAYQAQGTGAYMMPAVGRAAEGTYRVDEDGTVLLTLGDKVAAFTLDGTDFVYNKDRSKGIPEAAESIGDSLCIPADTRFTPATDGGTTPPILNDPTAAVGATHTVSAMGWMSEEEITAMFGYVPNGFPETHFLPIKMIRLRSNLDILLDTYAGQGVWTNLKAEDFAQFDEEFFKENDLVLTYYRDGCYQAEPSVSAYKITEEGKCLSVRLNVHQPAAGDTAVGQWLLFSAISKEDMDGIGVLEALVDSTTQETSAATLASFTGKVLQVEGDSVLMECYDKEQFSTVWVYLGTAELTPAVGEEYVISYEDMVMPSLPPRITAVTIQKP